MIFLNVTDISWTQNYVNILQILSEDYHIPFRAEIYSNYGRWKILHIVSLNGFLVFRYRKQTNLWEIQSIRFFSSIQLSSQKYWLHFQVDILQNSNVIEMIDIERNIRYTHRMNGVWVGKSKNIIKYYFRKH